MPQRRRWLVVDGALEARQAHGRTVPIEFRRTSRRRLPAMESQREPNDIEQREHIASEQRAAGQTDTAKGEDLQEALHRLCSCKRPESCRRGTGAATSRRVAKPQWES